MFELIVPEAPKGIVFFKKIRDLKSCYQSIDFESLMSIIETYIKHPVLLTLIYKACLADGLILVHKRNVKVLKANKDQASVRYGGVATAFDAPSARSCFFNKSLSSRSRGVNHISTFLAFSGFLPLRYPVLILKERSRPSEYKQKLRQFYNQILNPNVQPEEFAKDIKRFIQDEKYQIALSPFIYFGGDFHDRLLSSLPEEKRKEIELLQERFEERRKRGEFTLVEEDFYGRERELKWFYEKTKVQPGVAREF